MVSQETDSRNRILEAAQAEFAEKGFDGARVDAIAARAGVNKALLYYYFKSKSGLLDALFDDFFLELKTEKSRIAPPRDPEHEDDYWKAVIRQVVAVTRDRLDLLRVALLEELKGGAGHDRILRRWRTEWETAFEGSGQGALRPDQAVFNFFFEDLLMIVFLLLNQKWSTVMERPSQDTEEAFFRLLQSQSNAYWNRTKEVPLVP